MLSHLKPASTWRFRKPAVMFSRFGASRRPQREQPPNSSDGPDQWPITITTCGILQVTVDLATIIPAATTLPIAASLPTRWSRRTLGVNIRVVGHTHPAGLNELSTVDYAGGQDNRRQPKSSPWRRRWSQLGLVCISEDGRHQLPPCFHPGRYSTGKTQNINIEVHSNLISHGSFQIPSRCHILYWGHLLCFVRVPSGSITRHVCVLTHVQ